MRQKTQFTCPLCGHKNERYVETDALTKQEVATCDSETGGCDKTLVLTISARITVFARAVEGQREDTSLAAQLTDEELRHTFHRIVTGTDARGSFLTAFAESVLKADSANFALLRPLLRAYVEKYALVKFCDLCSKPLTFEQREDGTHHACATIESHKDGEGGLS